MRIVEVVADVGYTDTLTSIAEQYGAVDVWCGAELDDGRQSVRMLVSSEKRQAILDALQSVLGGSKNMRILVMPVDAALPRAAEADEAQANNQGKSASATREELYDQIEKGARLDVNFLLLVFLSTIVAAIGLVKDNVAVVVGAMVIAPLLGPNLALALATSLGDRVLFWRSVKTNVTGIALALGLAVAIGFFWPVNLDSAELMARTDVGMDSVGLALASGAAAVLSLATGLSSALVGVMVAVALLPPTAALGMMLGSGQQQLAVGAALLLAVNIVCVILAAKIVFLLKGVRPRTWLKILEARQSQSFYFTLWAVILGVLVGAIYLRSSLLG